MAWHEDILSDLPAPHDGEPASLRQDIADELLDHLQSAALRESLIPSHPEAIEQRVLTRFGNPRRIARQLWFDAMKEKLMLQKITLALVTFAAIASATACGLMLTFGMKANEELLKQNQRVMEQLTALANRESEPLASREWNPLTVRVVKNDVEKTPAQGIKVIVQGHAYSGMEKTGVEEQTTENGIADFGVVRPGEYWCQIESPWGEELGLTIVVKPGTSHTEEIICPAGPPKSVPVEPIINWPNELKGLPIAALVKVSRKDYTRINGKTRLDQHAKSLQIRPDGRFAVYESTSDGDLFGPQVGIQVNGEPEE
jgi:hypothetical protein